MKKICLLLLLLILITGCKTSIENVFVIPYKYKSILQVANTDFLAEVEEFTIYGKYFNIKGNFSYINDFDKLDLVFKSKTRELEYDLIYEINENGIIFKTNNFINEGINLEKISLDNYVILLRMITDDEIKYYNLINDSEYTNLRYYTITKNGTNNRIDISFAKVDEINFFKLEMKKNTNNQNICDVVIDPGHGGNDPGAINGRYKEKDFNLLYSKLIANELEELGLKVKLTRETDILPSFYGVNSRTGIPYECKAKLMLSIHLNSSIANVFNGGVEIYMAYNDNPNFPKVLADNIVSYTKTSYSPNNSYKVMDGVYMRTYSENDIETVLKDAKEGNWPFYENLDLNTTYYYFIRETGGIMTNAITDGRNTDYPGNPYYKSNYGVESYLVELGYISSTKNLEKLINEKNSYVNAIVESVKYYINN